MKRKLLCILIRAACITVAARAVEVPEIVLIPGGTFEMGDHHNLGGREHRNDELPIRTVSLKPFYIGKYEVTTAQYCDFLNSAEVEVRNGLVWMGDTLLCDTRQSSRYSRLQYDGKRFMVLEGKERHPVTGIRWHGAAAYCNWLSVQQKLKPCYSKNWKCDFSANGYRLPTEEEWEYAARGGLHSPYRIFPWGDDANPARANWPHSGDPFENGEEPYTTPVGYYDGSNHDGYQTLDGSNGYGLYDMAGNVWEWCNDLYSESSAYPEIGKPMPDGKIYHVLRGGSWYNGLWGHSRVSNRNPGYFRGPKDPNHPYYHIGLRVARNAVDVPLIAGELKILGDHFQFTEGPASDGADNVFFTDIRANRIYILSAEEKLSVFREESGGANGLYFDKDGNLIVCEGDNGRITAISPEGKTIVLADMYNGRRFNKPNDLWADLKGGIYFTDPCYGHTQRTQDGEHVYYLLPDRSKVIRVIDDFVRPNGIIGTPDGKTLYVADAGDGKIWKYTINADGTLSDKTFFAGCSSDGMTLDALGNLYTTQESVLIFNPEGKQIGEIKTPARPTNVTFGGKANRTLFITARTHLCSVKMNVRGIDRPVSDVGKIPPEIFQAWEKPDRKFPGMGKRPHGGGGQRPEGRPDKPWLLEHSQELDVDRDGAVSRQEMLNEAEKAFDMYDANRDGRLSQQEVKGTGMARTAMGGFIKLHFAELDSNSDGIILKPELLDETGRMFDKSDKNRDGKVNQADENRSGGRYREKQVKQPGGGRFAETDLNRNGKITFGEFVTREKKRKGSVDESRVRKKFEQIDKNNDGIISEQELTAAPKGRRRKR